MFDSLDELVADMVVDPDTAHAQSKHTQGVLVIISHRPMADCIKGRAIFNRSVTHLFYHEVLNQSEAQRLCSALKISGDTKHPLEL